METQYLRTAHGFCSSGIDIENTVYSLDMLGAYLSSFLGYILVSMVSLIIGVLVVKIWQRGDKVIVAEQRVTLAAQNGQLDEQRDAIQQFSTRVAVADEKISQMPRLELRLQEAESRVEAIKNQLLQEAAERARAEQEARQIPQIQAQLREKQESEIELRNAITGLKTDNTELQTRLQEQSKNVEEKLKLLRDAETQLSHRFETLANKILDEKSKKFTEQNRANIDGVLKPLREQLGDFKKKVDDVYVNDSKDRASLREEIRGLRQQTQQINKEAINLTRALKGEKKTQGNWGELVLERVLEQSGLRKGIEYETQTAFRNTDNRLLKPDVIVHLPQGKDVVIDSKVSLVAYEKYASEEDDDAARQVALKAHIEAVRAHINALSGKDYSGLKGLRSLDFVLMFMPIEAAFTAAFQHDEKLFNNAFEEKIVVVTPTTLLATLRTVENIWRFERQNENAKLIADKAGTIYDKVRGLVEDFEKLGTQLGTVQNTYDAVMNKLTRGQGNLIRQTSSLVELGVKVKKSLSKTILEEAGVEPESDTPSLEVVKSDKSVNVNFGKER